MMMSSTSATSILQLGYHVDELRLLTGDGGEVELSLSLGEPESGPAGPERRKAHRHPVDVSFLGAVWGLLYDHIGVINVGYCRAAFNEQLQYSNK